MTGETRYVDDVFDPGTLTVKALRSPVHKGIIRKLDIARAEKLPGVHGIITAPMCPATPMATSPWIRLSWPRGDVRYIGEPIAAVAADTVEIANEAIDLIDLEIETADPGFRSPGGHEAGRAQGAARGKHPYGGKPTLPSGLQRGH